MTPERALQIASAALDAPERTAQCFLNAILAACAEERRAALTEAAEMVERRGSSYKGFYPEAQTCRTECEQIAATIESLRDRD